MTGNKSFLFARAAFGFASLGGCCAGGGSSVRGGAARTGGGAKHGAATCQQAVGQGDWQAAARAKSRGEGGAGGGMLPVGVCRPGPGALPRVGRVVGAGGRGVVGWPAPTRMKGRANKWGKGREAARATTLRAGEGGCRRQVGRIWWMRYGGCDTVGARKERQVTTWKRGGAYSGEPVSQVGAGGKRRGQGGGGGREQCLGAKGGGLVGGGRRRGAKLAGTSGGRGGRWAGGIGAFVGAECGGFASQTGQGK